MATIDSTNEHDSSPQQTPFQTPVQTFTTIAECLDAMDRITPDAVETETSMTVVLFFAHYCKLCHQANIPYKRMAYKNSQEESQRVRFTRFETSAMSPRQLKLLGVTKVPFLQIYRNGDCVASFSTKWKLGESLRDALSIIEKRNAEDWNQFFHQFAGEIADNKAARTRLRVEVLLDPSPEDETGIRTLASEHQLLDAIHQSTMGDEDQPTVVLFHSHFQHSSQRAQYQYRRIAEKQKKAFLLTRIETSTLAESTLQALDVMTQSPFVQIYKSGMCVASFSIPQTYLFNKLVYDNLEAVQKRSAEEWNSFRNEFAEEIQTNHRALESIAAAQFRP